MRPKKIFFRFTVSEKNVPPRLRSFSETLDKKEGPALQPKDWNRGDSIRVYTDVLPNQSLDEFVKTMEAEHVLVLAWYEQKPDPNNPKRIYHVLVFVFVHKDDPDVHCYPRFSPVRPKIRAEFGELITASTWNVRRFDDNQLLDKNGNPVKGWRRWELNLNGRQPMNPSRQKECLVFRGA